jgi:MFS family permease
MFIIFLIPFFLLHGKKMATTEIGILLASIQIVRLFIAPAAGIWTDRIGARRMATFGLFVTTAGFALMSQFDSNTSFQLIAISLIITGIGASIFDPSNEHAVLGSIPSEKLASGTALTTTARQVGFSISTTIAGTMYAYRLKYYESYLGDSTLAVTHAYQEVILLGLAIMVFATLLSYARGVQQKTIWYVPESKIH